jgi:hypothetical protein
MDKSIPVTDRDRTGNTAVHTMSAVQAVTDLLNALCAAGWSRDDVELAGIQSVLQHRMHRLADRDGNCGLRDLEIAETLLNQMLRDEAATMARVVWGEGPVPPPIQKHDPHLKLVSTNKTPRKPL